MSGGRTSAALALQSAILAWLRASPLLMSKLAGQGVYDHVPVGAAFPYLTFGPSQVFGWDTASEYGEEHHLVLQIWARSNGRKLVMELMVIVEDLLEAMSNVPMQPAEIGSYQLVNLTLQSSLARNEDIRDGYCGQLRFRAVTEKIS